MKVIQRKIFSMPVVLGMILLAFLLVPLLSSAQPSAPSSKSFWQGKTMTVLVGTSSSGGYDSYARLVARHLPKHLPGKPVIIIKNMPEGKGVGMVNQLYRSRPDGLAFAIINRDLPVQQLVGTPGIRFDLAKLSWLGSTTVADQIFYIRADKGWNSLADVSRSSQTVNVAASGIGSSPFQFLRAIELAFRLKFNIVNYPGTGERMLAIEKGEVEGGTLDTDPFMSSYKHLLDRGVVKVILQTGPGKNPFFPDVPTVPELLEKLPTDPTGAALLRIFPNSTAFGRPFAGPPGISKDRFDILYKAFAQTLEDPELLKEAKKLRLTIHPVSGKEIERLVKGTLNQPPEIVSLFKAMFKR